MARRFDSYEVTFWVVVVLWAGSVATLKIYHLVPGWVVLTYGLIALAVMHFYAYKRSKRRRVRTVGPPAEPSR